ncbi:MAG: glycosyltransferase [Bacteroidales bacterium]|nr:glycosyltransferase [Bacteroidales bacterium]
MKILQINSVYKVGSTGRIVESLHNYFLNCGEQSYVIYGRGKCYKNDKNVFKLSGEFFNKINALRARITGMLYSGNFIATKKIIRKIEKIRPDIVHIHNLNDNFVNVYKLLKFLAIKGYKVVMTLHSEQMYTGTCGYALGCEKWASGGCKNCPHLYLSTKSYIDNTKKAFNKLFKVYSLFNSNNIKVIGCTPWLTKRAQRSILLNRFDNQSIINGSSTDDFSILDNVQKEEKSVLFINPRIDDPVKGHQFLSGLVKVMPEYKFTVVGPYTNKTKRVDGVLYTGRITDKKKLVEYYNKANVTLMMSENECFPMTIIESLLCGTKVCLFKCFGPDECYDSEYVKFSKYSDIHELAQNIKLVKNYDNSIVRKYAIKSLSERRMASDYLKLYKSIFESN